MDLKLISVRTVRGRCRRLLTCVLSDSFKLAYNIKSEKLVHDRGRLQ